MNESAAAFWNRTLAPYKIADNRVAATQLVTTFALYVAAWWSTLRVLEVSFLLSLPLALLTGFLVIRLFIFQHDCGHGSFFSSQRANNWVGFLLGIITLTPYQYWRRTHALHHATSGNLDHRGWGDISTLTVNEYLARSRWDRLRYRLYRNGIVLLVIGPVYEFVFRQRLPLSAPRDWKREWTSVMGTNLVLAAAVLGMVNLVGWKSFLLVQMPIVSFSCGIGIWLFYVQHQFEDTYWERQADWDVRLAGLQGSSFYDLHPVLHWLTGNIGYHHIHHLSSRIPNYRLQQAMAEIPELQNVTRFGLFESFKCLKLKLWDEEQKRLVSWDAVKAQA